MSLNIIMRLLCAGLAVAVTPAVQAEEAPSGLKGPFGQTAAMDSGALQSIAGMANLGMIATANNSSLVSGNSVNGQSVTGQVTIDGQSFQNMNGLSILTANTGNNVAINAAMNVNVSIQQ